MNIDPVLISAATVVMTVAGTMVSTTWRVSRLVSKYDNTLIKIMAEHELADTQRFAATRASIVEMGDQVGRDVGESMAAIRQKIYEVEMWGRDHLVQKEGLEDKIDQRILSAARHSA